MFVRTRRSTSVNLCKPLWTLMNPYEKATFSSLFMQNLGNARRAWSETPRTRHYVRLQRVECVCVRMCVSFCVSYTYIYRCIPGDAPIFLAMSRMHHLRDILRRYRRRDVLRRTSFLPLALYEHARYRFKGVVHPLRGETSQHAPWQSMTITTTASVSVCRFSSSSSRLTSLVRAESHDWPNSGQGRSSFFHGPRSWNDTSCTTMF